LVSFYITNLLFISKESSGFYGGVVPGFATVLGMAGPDAKVTFTIGLFFLTSGLTYLFLFFFIIAPLLSFPNNF
jgi:hypothetical protein